MTAQQIYAKLVKAGLSPIGACAMMGNMYAESALRANNAQDGMTRLTDEQYTEQTDSGLYQSFVTDSVGYGLCQWTYAPRKRKLLEFARARGVSIGDAEMQVDFCLWELRNEYSHLLKYLYTATNLYEATGRICKEYERPAVNNISVRAAFADEYYCQFGGCDVDNMENSMPPTPDNTKPVELPTIEWPPRELGEGDKGADVCVLQALLLAHGFSIAVDGDFGRNTKIALLGWQAKNGLAADGVCTGETWDTLLRRE